jgi:hypothetical protein
MKTPKAGRLAGYACLWLGAALAAMAFLSCNTDSEDAKTYFQLHADSTWLGYDSLQVWLDKGNGSAPSLLFSAKLSSVSDLDKLPADGYGNGQATLIFRAYADGRVARAENLEYDFARQRILGIIVLILPGSGGAQTDSAIAKGGLFLSMGPGDTLVSIGDTVPLLAAGWNDSGSLLEARWDLDGDEAADRVEHPAAASAVLRALARFAEPGVYHPSLTLKGSQGGTLTRAVTVRVVLSVRGPADTAHTPLPAGVNLTVGAQASVYGAVIDIDSERTWTAALAYANQQDIDLVFQFYANALHLDDAVSARDAGIAQNINLTNGFDAAKIVHVDMVRITSEPPDQETAKIQFDSSAKIIHGAVVGAGDMFLVKSTGGKLAFLKVVSLTGTDRAAQGAVLLKVLTL